MRSARRSSTARPRSACASAASWSPGRPAGTSARPSSPRSAGTPSSSTRTPPAIRCSAACERLPRLRVAPLPLRAAARRRCARLHPARLPGVSLPRPRVGPAVPHRGRRDDPHVVARQPRGRGGPARSRRRRHADPQRHDAPRGRVRRRGDRPRGALRARRRRAAAALRRRPLDSGPMAHVPSVRHLLRAKDPIDARYREPLDVPALAQAAAALAGPLQPRVPPRVRRDAAPVPADAPARARRGAAAQHRSLGGRDLPRRRAAQRRLVHDELRPRLRHVADRLPGRVSAGRDPRPVPTCVAAGVRPPAVQQFSRRQPRSGARNVSLVPSKPLGGRP